MAKILALCFSLIAMCMDLRNEKIANGAIGIFVLIGMFYQIGLHKTAGIWIYAKGALLPILLLFILFIFRMLGPGDIKLLSSLGGVIGAAAILKCILFSFIFGALISIAILIFCGNLKQRLRYLADYFTNLFETKTINSYYKPGMQMENFHFSVPIFMSIILYVGGIY